MLLKHVCEDCESTHKRFQNKSIENVEIKKVSKDHVLSEKDIIYLPKIWHEKALHKGKIIKIHSDDKIECVFYCMFGTTFLKKEDVYINKS